MSQHEVEPSSELDFAVAGAYNALMITAEDPERAERARLCIASWTEWDMPNSDGSSLFVVSRAQRIPPPTELGDTFGLRVRSSKMSPRANLQVIIEGDSVRLHRSRLPVEATPTGKEILRLIGVSDPALLREYLTYRISGSNTTTTVTTHSKVSMGIPDSQRISGTLEAREDRGTGATIRTLDCRPHEEGGLPFLPFKLLAYVEPFGGGPLLTSTRLRYYQDLATGVEDLTPEGLAVACNYLGDCVAQLAAYHQ